MTAGYSRGLCLFGFLPNLAFLVGAFFLVRTARLARGRHCACFLMTSGALLVFLGGTLKAIWKLLYASGLGDVRVFSEAQFVRAGRSGRARRSTTRLVRSSARVRQRINWFP